jgi:hypothetical protein
MEFLPDVARQLRDLEDIFVDWGVFRAIAHDLVWQELQAG